MADKLWWRGTKRKQHLPQNGNTGSQDFKSPTFVLQPFSTLFGFPQHLATIVEVIVHVPHRVALEFSQGILHLR